MSDQKFAFLILHYNEKHTTIQCVNSIKANTENYDVQIVIVDNASPDGSGQALAKIYEGDTTVTVLQAEKNLGFAGGNNLGYTYLKNTVHADFICVMNNDVLLLQKDFIQRILQEYKQSNCGIIGPHITLLNGMTNYMYLKLHPIAYYENELRLSKTMYKYYTSRLYPIRNIINTTIQKIEARRKRPADIEKESAEAIDMILASKQRHENIILHGCCLVFTPAYIQKFEDAFNNETFMFREEELLYLRCQQNKIDTVYEPSIDILHLEDKSTNAAFKKNNHREAFKCKCQIKSLQILLKELKA